MYKTTLSRASLSAESAVSAPGLASHLFVSPILCCPAVPAVEVAVEALLNVGTELAADGGGNGSGQCPESSLDFTAAVTYVPPGRLSVNAAPVSDNASVDDLISAARAGLNAA